jgi:hypothetical protein
MLCFNECIEGQYAGTFFSSKNTQLSFRQA